MVVEVPALRKTTPSPSRPLSDSTLITRAFVSGPSEPFASGEYLRRRGAPKRAHDLADHDIIGFGKIPGGMLRMTCDDFLTTRAFVALGLGIGFMPAFLAAEAAPPLVRVLPQLAHQRTGLYFAYPAQRLVPPRVERFIAFAASAAADLFGPRER